MAEKTTTVTIKVDPACADCKKTLDKILCKLKGQANVKITKDEKTNTITISGKFDAQEIYNKLSGCKDCNVKIDLNIKVEPKKPPPPEDCNVINKIKIRVNRGSCHEGCYCVCKKE